jgi:hypothetical protein
VSTAALLPTPGDPKLARYWLNNYRQKWQGEVDELHVLINGSASAEHLYRSVGARVTVINRKLGHGQAMRALLDDCSAETVVFVEDDAFVREPGAISERLRLAGSGCVVGCPRGGMDPVIGQAAETKWGPVVGPDGSSGHGLWPAFLFARRSDLMDTDRRFESWTWSQGEPIPGLGFQVPSSMTTDTMTAVAFQLRDRVPIVLDVNYKELYQKQFPGSAPWFHAGGLSNDPDSAREGMGDSNEGRDWAHRFWWWRRIGYDHREQIARAGVDVDYWTPIIEPWINWDE